MQGHPGAGDRSALLDQHHFIVHCIALGAALEPGPPFGRLRQTEWTNSVRAGRGCLFHLRSEVVLKRGWNDKTKPSGGPSLSAEPCRSQLPCVRQNATLQQVASARGLLALTSW